MSQPPQGPNNPNPHNPPPQPFSPNYRPPPRDDTVATLIPYRNVPALVSYYLGVFSLIPCIGAFLGIAAVILGIKGLKLAAANPASKGKVHAIVGIVCGGLFGLAWIVADLFFIFGMVMAAGESRR